MSKTISFAAVHFTVAFTLTWLITGSVAAGGLVALIEPACNTVAFHFHEKAWRRFAGRPAPRWWPFGRSTGRGTATPRAGAGLLAG